MASMTSSALSLCPAHDLSIDPERKEVLLSKCSGGHLILPIPHLLQEMSHVDLLRLHLYHPRVLKHAPWCGSARALLLKAAKS